jgi:hypothetical protein
MVEIHRLSVICCKLRTVPRTSLLSLPTEYWYTETRLKCGDSVKFGNKVRFEDNGQIEAAVRSSRLLY